MPLGCCSEPGWVGYIEEPPSICASKALGRMRGPRRIQCTHLLGALLLGEHLFFLRDNLRLVFQAECERESDQQRGRCHDPDNVPEDFPALLEKGRGGGDF